MRTALCRGCGAEIGFIKTVAGKTMPVNAKLVRFANDGGKEVFVMENGTVVHGTSLTDSQAAPDEMTGYTSHFATCPASGSFRKPRESNRKKG